MKDLQSIFQLPYAEFREAYLEQLVYPVFGRESLLEGEGRGVVRRHAELQQLAADTGISDIEHLGDLVLAADATTSLFDVTVADRVRLRRNRAAVQRCIHRLMDRYSCALIIFHYADRPLDPFRLTFCARRGGTEMTDTQRYTYIVGPGQPCRTVADRFVALGQKQGMDITFRDLEAAFAVQPLSDAFFNRYRELYADIVAYATGKRMVKTGNKWEEKTVATPSGPIMQPFRQQFKDEAEKRVRDYIKKLMGRLVFIQFVQRKGWMNGEPDYLQRLYRDYEQEHGSEDTRFVDDRLERVFSCLNTPEGTPGRPSLAGIPYLNGGLFGEDGCDRLCFPLPAHFIGEVLSFFGQYNFTIDENDPNEAEVGIDPEMLGRIFESLLEDNKDKGAFYTPKEIVHYMCRESLTAYLLTGITDEPTREAITRFVATHNSEALRANPKLAEQVADHLEAVKICDPAIGSGAFPMGLLRELYALREALADGTPDHDPAKLKRHIIEHNIYGVDIDRGAVDIARLRFWLALIVDEEQPQPLPNLDFKIMMGNSLIEEYRGVNLATVTQRKQCEQTNFVEDMTDCQRLILGKNIHDYYSEPDHEKKATLHTKIINGVYSVLAENNITPSIIASLRHEGIEDNTRFFLFHTWFYDVFKDNGGFDIVIGNPPYIQLQKLPVADKELYKAAKYLTYHSMGDICCLFYERGMQLLRPEGQLCFITTNKWMGTDYGAPTRKYFLQHTDPQLLIDFQGVKVFESASVDVNILRLAKQTYQGQTLGCVAENNDRAIVDATAQYVADHHVRCTFRPEQPWVILSPLAQRIKDKIEAAGTPLKDWDIQINYGIKTGYNKAFIIGEDKRNEILANCKSQDERQRTEELIRPMLKGRDILDEGYKWAGRYLINVHNGVKKRLPRINIEEYPAIKAHLDSHWEKLEHRADQGDTPYNLRNCAYIEDFRNPKLFYADITQHMNFCLCEDYMLCDNTIYFMASPDKEFLKSLATYLNSKLVDWYYRLISVQLGEKAARMFTIYVLNIPVPCDLTADPYKVFGLTPEEISLIENS